MTQLMPLWTDYSTFSLGDVTGMWLENRAWGKELRLSTRELVDKRLAHQISPEEYAAGRQRLNEEREEYLRRATLLVRERERLIG